MTTPCTYCGADVEAHDPVYVYEQETKDRAPAGEFCNYACLSSHIEEENLTTGDACEWSPD